jgi:hypothetical protein
LAAKAVARLCLAAKSKPLGGGAGALAAAGLAASADMVQSAEAKAFLLLAAVALHT